MFLRRILNSDFFGTAARRRGADGGMRFKSEGQGRPVGVTWGERVKGVWVCCEPGAAGFDKMGSTPSTKAEWIRRYAALKSRMWWRQQ